MNMPAILSTTLPFVPAVLGLAVAFAVELVTAPNAAARIKRATCAALSLLAGVLPTIVYTPAAGWRQYASAVLVAWVVAIVTHASGITHPVQTATARVGVGRNSIPDGGSAMQAGADVPPDATT